MTDHRERKERPKRGTACFLPLFCPCFVPVWCLFVLCVSRTKTGQGTDRDGTLPDKGLWCPSFIVIYIVLCLTGCAGRPMLKRLYTVSSNRTIILDVIYCYSRGLGFSDAVYNFSGRVLNSVSLFF